MPKRPTPDAPLRMESKTFILYTADARTHVIEAPSIRTALRNFGGPPEAILAAVNATCVPKPAKGDRPFFAVLLANAAFAPPPLE